MDSNEEKRLKEEMNEALQLSIAEGEPEKESIQTSMDRIQETYDRTHTMIRDAKEKNKWMEEQFRELKQKIQNSSESLMKMRKNMEKLKFSFQQKMLDRHNMSDPGSCLESGEWGDPKDFPTRMEEIRTKIDELQVKMNTSKEQQKKISQNYQQAFEKVMQSFEDIETGAYSSEAINLEDD